MTVYYKGFDKDFRCRGFQYEVGKSYEEQSASLCKTGFHACENPVDVLTYFPPCTSRYATVELDGIADSVGEERKDSKVCAKKITILSELGVKEYIAACAAWFSSQKFDAQSSGGSGHAQSSGYSGHAQSSGDSGHAQSSGKSGHAQSSGDFGHAQSSGDSGHAQSSGYFGHAQSSGYYGHAQSSGGSGHAQSSGYSGHAQSSGYSGHAQSSGDFGHAQSSGDFGHAQSSGDSSVAVSLGKKGTAMAAGKAKFIVLADWRDDKLVDVKVGRVGDNIEGDKKYTLIDGEFIEKK